MTLSHSMNFSIPDDLKKYLADLDKFIDEKITPLQHKDDNNRFFDHRREHARTDWDNGGLPRKEWEELLTESRKLADEAGFYRLSLPKQYGGQNSEDGRGSNLWMAVIREHLAAKGLGLFNDLQTEHSMVGNFPDVIMLMNFGNEQQKKEFIPLRLQGKFRMTFGLTEPGHGKDGEIKGISCFIVPRDTPGLVAESYEWTLNMPTDHATVSIKDVWVPESAALGPIHNGLGVAQAFVHENRIRQAASSLGAAVYCASKFPLVELATQCEMLRQLIRKTALEMDSMPHHEIEKKIGDKVSMCNYYANRLCTQAADRAIQVHGGNGYSRHYPFEHIWRHHRRYRITEGSEEIQMRKVAAYLFGFGGRKSLVDATKAESKL
ncbi:hypothetical protein N0V83_005459 [Neocucurbitaria cava]|uniref:Acyl-CoA dehydrogenase n=1 Tax=Neocucurbitaria cava TaxID=798079 RepID=A0A9W8Y7Y3_9PLEO|nr:hypothetical protein N0V83_005459 [Neocucurbitaria cava]